MNGVEKLVAKLRSRCAVLVVRLRERLDAHAEHQKTGWGSSMEYKRRYTNPDDAKRQRVPSDFDRRQ
jgi:hypothetical protein